MSMTAISMKSPITLQSLPTPVMPHSLTSAIESSGEPRLSRFEQLPVELLQLIRDWLPLKTAWALMECSKSLFHALNPSWRGRYRQAFQEEELNFRVRRCFLGSYKSGYFLESLRCRSKLNLSYYEVQIILSCVRTAMNNSFAALSVESFKNLLSTTNSDRILQQIFCSPRFTHLTRVSYLYSWRKTAEAGNQVAVASFLRLHDQSPSNPVVRFNKNTFQTGFLKAVKSNQRECIDVFFAYKGFGCITSTIIKKAFNEAIVHDLANSMATLIDHARFDSFGSIEYIEMLSAAMRRGAEQVTQVCLNSDVFCAKITREPVDNVLLGAIGQKPSQSKTIALFLESPHADRLQTETLGTAWKKATREARLDILQELGKHRGVNTIPTHCLTQSLFHVTIRNDISVNPIAKFLITHSSFSRLSKNQHSLLVTQATALHRTGIKDLLEQTIAQLPLENSSVS